MRKLAESLSLLCSHQCIRPPRDLDSNMEGETKEILDNMNVPNLMEDDFGNTSNEVEWVRGYERLSGDTVRSGLIDDGPGTDMVATGLESDPEDVIGW